MYKQRRISILKQPSLLSPLVYPLVHPSPVTLFHRIHGDSHIELPCNEVHGEEKEDVARMMEGAARQWWQSLLAEPHSFNKPTFQLGFNGWSVTNILPDGAHERTPGRVELLPNGAAGFSRIGDSMCFGVKVSCCPAWCQGVVCCSGRSNSSSHNTCGRQQDRLVETGEWDRHLCLFVPQNGMRWLQL